MRPPPQFGHAADGSISFTADARALSDRCITEPPLGERERESTSRERYGEAMANVPADAGVGVLDRKQFVPFLPEERRDARPARAELRLIAPVYFVDHDRTVSAQGLGHPLKDVGLRP